MLPACLDACLGSAEPACLATSALLHASAYCRYHAFGNAHNNSGGGGGGGYVYQHGESEWREARPCRLPGALSKCLPCLPTRLTTCLPARPPLPHPPACAVEGLYNRYMLCAQHFHPKQAEWFPYVKCFADNMAELDAKSDGCATDLRWNAGKIKACASGGELGKQLERDAAAATWAAHPTKTFVPWVRARARRRC